MITVPIRDALPETLAQIAARRQRHGNIVTIIGTTPDFSSSAAMTLRCQNANHPQILWAWLAVAVLAGCASLSEGPHADRFSYSYFSLNFSGKAWDKARRYCADRGKLTNHVGTTCGFFICTTEVSCITEQAE